MTVTASSIGHTEQQTRFPYTCLRCRNVPLFTILESFWFLHCKVYLDKTSPKLTQTLFLTGNIEAIPLWLTEKLRQFFFILMALKIVLIAQI